MESPNVLSWQEARELELKDYVRQHPIGSVAATALVGFSVGGGFTSRVGFSALMLATRVIVRRALLGSLVTMLYDDFGRDRKDGKHRKDGSRAGSGSRRLSR
jgi:hypothetical protein